MCDLVRNTPALASLARSDTSHLDCSCDNADLNGIMHLWRRTMGFSCPMVSCCRAHGATSLYLLLIAFVLVLPCSYTSMHFPHFYVSSHTPFFLQTCALLVGSRLRRWCAASARVQFQMAMLRCSQVLHP